MYCKYVYYSRIIYVVIFMLITINQIYTALSTMCFGIVVSKTWNFMLEIVVLQGMKCGYEQKNEKKLKLIHSCLPCFGRKKWKKIFVVWKMVVSLHSLFRKQQVLIKARELWIILKHEIACVKWVPTSAGTKDTDESKRL